MADPVVVPATPALVKHFYGEAPGRTLRAWVALIDGEPAGIMGLSYDGDKLVAFSMIRDALRPHRKFIVRQARRLVQEARKRGGAVAVADPHEPLSSRLLERAGFVPIGMVAGKEAFSCR